MHLIIQFDPGIEVDIDCSHNGNETVLGQIPDSHLMKMIVIKNTIVDPFGTSPVLIDHFPFIRPVS